MGGGMVINLLKAGYDVGVYSRRKETAQGCMDAGAVWKNSVAQLASEADVIITIVGFPRDVEALYFGGNGVLNHAREHAVLIDMTTSDPALAIRVYEAAAEKNIRSLDAPVSGGDIGARNATLSIMVGGDRDAFNACRPVFEAMGRNIVYQGPAGSGQHTKMCNQIANAGVMLGVCEALAYAKQSGLDPRTVLESIAGGAAGSWALSNLAPRIIEGDFAPGFFVKHFIKDMQIAFDAAEALGLDLPALGLALSRYQQLAEAGGENDGTQALFRLYG